MATMSSTNQSLTDKIDSIQTIDAALPYLKALPISAIKLFLGKSAKYGFFDKIAFDEIDDESTANNKNDDETKRDDKNNDIDNKEILKWCKLSSWILNKLEWTQSGYQYDETTQSIDTTKPLSRCAYCLQYQNHASWCQLEIALKEYETNIKPLCIDIDDVQIKDPESSQNNDNEEIKQDETEPKISEYSFKLNKTNKRVFDVLDHGLTLKGNFKKDHKYDVNDWQNNPKLYAFGTIMFGKFLKKPSKLIVHMRLNKNCVNNGIGFGFIGMRCNQYIDQTQNSGENHCCFLYGDGRYYTSYEFVNNDYEHGSVLKPFTNYFKNGEVVVIELDMKSDKPIGKIYNIKDMNDSTKHFTVALKTTNNAIAICANVTFKPSIAVIKQTIE